MIYTTYYDRLKYLNAEELSIGLKRLGRVLKASREIQNLTGRDFFKLTKIFYEVGISATHVGDIEKGHRMSRENTIQRLVPFILEVDHFEFIGDDKIGIPHFKYKGENYKGTSKYYKIATMCTFIPNGTNECDRPKINQLPDIEFRCTVISQIVDIITGSDRFNFVCSNYQMKTPIRSVA